LLDFSGRFRSYFIDDFPYEEEAVRKFLQNPRLAELVTILLQRYELDDVFTVESTEKHLRAVAAEQGIKAGLLINALRVGLTGQAVAPGLFDVMQALGRARTLARMRRLAQYLRPADQRREEDDQAGSQY
jgi:glutamyl-tRNA synthetase